MMVLFSVMDAMCNSLNCSLDSIDPTGIQYDTREKHKMVSDTCEKIIKEIETNPSKSIWSYEGLTPETYHCLGQNLAQRDINNNIFLIQSNGSLEWTNPCIVCRYKSYGFHFYYYEDIVEDNITNFIEGYNEISKGYLKNQIGDSAFAHINDVPNEYFNPAEIIYDYLSSANIKRPYSYTVVNDSIINVRFNLDSLFKDNTYILSKTVFIINEFNGSPDTTTLTLNYQQLKGQGFQVKEKQGDKYTFKITFDFTALESEERFCWCGLPNERITRFRIPIIVNKE